MTIDQATDTGATPEATLPSADTTTPASTPSTEVDAAEATARRQPEVVGPLGGILFSAFCLAAWVGTVVTVAVA